MEQTKARKYLFAGFIGALITVVGEMLEGCVTAPDASTEMARLFSTLEVLPVWRIGLGSTLGGFGILMQYFGFRGLSLTFDNRQSKWARAYDAGAVGFTIIGAMVHILCSVLMYGYQCNLGTELLERRFAEFTVWFMMPILVIFFGAYILFAAAMFAQLAKGHTAFPKWCCALNPIFGKAIINAVIPMLPNKAIFNGIGFSDMGITSLIIFAVLLAKLTKTERA